MYTRTHMFTSSFATAPTSASTFTFASTCTFAFSSTCTFCICKYKGICIYSRLTNITSCININIYILYIQMQVHNLGIRACPFPTNSYSNLNLKNIFPVEPQLEIRLKQVSKFKKHHLESIHPLKKKKETFHSCFKSVSNTCLGAVSTRFQTVLWGSNPHDVFKRSNWFKMVSGSTQIAFSLKF